MPTAMQSPQKARQLLTIPTLIGSLVCAQLMVLFCDAYICTHFNVGAYTTLATYLSGLVLPVLVRLVFLLAQRANSHPVEQRDG